MTVRRAFRWVAFWISTALLFNIGVYIFGGKQLALEFFGGYLIELSLSVDNLFLFLMIFTSFGVDAKYQRRALNYGIAGAVIMRFLFIAMGSVLVAQFEWMLYIFGAILIFSGARMLLFKEKETDYKGSKFLMLFARHVPFTGSLEGEKFFIKKSGKLYATLLFAILLLIEFSDILFAIDSIPAIFSITTNVLIVYTSNIFAILGLRSLYFMLEKLYSIFHCMKYGVAVVLIFTGMKLVILYFGIEIPILLSIGIIAGILLVSIAASVLISKPEKA